VNSLRSHKKSFLGYTFLQLILNKLSSCGRVNHTEVAKTLTIQQKQAKALLFML